MTSKNKHKYKIKHKHKRQHKHKCLSMPKHVIHSHCAHMCFFIERQMIARHSLVIKNTHDQPYMTAHV